MGFILKWKIKTLKLAADAWESSGQTVTFFWYKFMLGLSYPEAWRREIGNTLGETRRTKQLTWSQRLNGFCKLRIEQASASSIPMSLIWWHWEVIYSVKEREIICPIGGVFFPLTLSWLFWILSIRLKDKTSKHITRGVLASIFYYNCHPQICIKVTWGIFQNTDSLIWFLKPNLWY